MSSLSGRQIKDKLELLTGAHRLDASAIKGIGGGGGVVPSGTGWTHITSGAQDSVASTPTKSDVGLSAVENTALSTWIGSTNITTLGNITTGASSGSGTGDTNKLVKYGTNGVLRATDAITANSSTTARIGTLTSIGLNFLGTDTFKTFLAFTAAPGSDKTITFPNTTGTVVTTGDTGSVTSTMLAGSIAASKLVGSDISTVGTVTSGTWSGSFGAVSGANLTTLNAANLASNTVPTARLGSGSASSSTFLRGDSSWATPAGGSALTGKTLWVDSVNGNNGTAVSGDLGHPYLTLAAAKAAATSGDLVIVLPGTYTPTTSILKNGVNWHFEAGATVSLVGSSNVGILDDQNSAVTCTISGEGDFYQESTSAADILQ